MKIKQKFKDIKKPKDIHPDELNKYFCKLYRTDKIDVTTISYASDNTEELIEKRKQQINILVDTLIELSGNQRFEPLRAQLQAEISKAKDGKTHDEMRRAAEAICYKLAKGLVHSKQKFNDEVNSFTIDACSPGAVTNLQNVLYVMDDSLYVQKYNYIQNLANAYIRDNKLNFIKGTEYIGDESHNANMLLHEVSRDYCIQPPYDPNARYRNLDLKPLEELKKYAQFKVFLDQHFSNREGIHSFIDHMTSNYFSNLPAPQNFSGAGEELNEMRNKIDEAAKACGVSMDNILTYSLDYTTIEYHPNYLSILKAGMMRKLAQEGIIEADFLIIDGKQIIESPDAWFEVDPNTQEYRELFSTKEIKGLTIDGKNLEQYIHDELKQKSPHEASTILKLINTKKLILESDQARNLKKMMSLEEIDSIPLEQMHKWLDFSNCITKDSELLSFIAKYGNPEIFHKYLQLKGKTYEDLETTRDFKGKSLLHLAIEHSNQEMIDLLINHKINVDAQDKQRNTPLHIAAMKGNHKLFKQLINAGANQAIANSNSLTPLQEATKLKNEYFLPFLETGAAINIKGKTNKTALLYAIEINDTETAKALIKKGADLNAVDKEGNSALHYAAQNNNTDTIRILLEAGADTSIKNHDNENFIDMSRNYHLQETFQQINQIYQEHLQKIKEKSQHSVTKYHLTDLASVERFIKEASNINASNQDGKTLLHHLASAQFPDKENSAKLLELIEKTISAGADLFIIDSQGKTPLAYAIEEGSIEVAEKLIEVIKENYGLEHEDIVSIINVASIRSTEDIVRIKSKLGILAESIVTSLHDKRDSVSEKPRSLSENSVVEIPQEKPLMERSISESTIATSRNGSTSDLSVSEPLEKVKKDFITMLDKKYVFRNTKVKEKAKQYIQSFSLNSNQVNSKNYDHYIKGEARKGVLSKFAAKLISGVRNTDNEMIQEITRQFKAYAEDQTSYNTSNITLPKRYKKKHSTITQ